MFGKTKEFCVKHKYAIAASVGVTIFAAGYFIAKKNNVPVSRVTSVIDIDDAITLKELIDTGVTVTLK